MGVLPTIGGKYVDMKLTREGTPYVSPVHKPNLMSVIDKKVLPWDFYYPMLCTNCGYTHWFSAINVTTWMKLDRDNNQGKD